MPVSKTCLACEFVITEAISPSPLSVTNCPKCGASFEVRSCEHCGTALRVGHSGTSVSAAGQRETCPVEVEMGDWPILHTVERCQRKAQLIAAKPEA